MGQSAGASSILHHITSYGGEEDGRQDRKPKFQSAVLQSPGFFPQPNGTKDDITYQRFLDLAESKNLDDLMEKDFSVLQHANAVMTYESEYGYFNFGPTIDGNFVPDLPGRSLAAGKFHTGIPIMLGHQGLDGLLFTPPWIRDDAGLAKHVKDLYPEIPDTEIAYIKKEYHIPKDPTPWTPIVAQAKLGVVSDFLDVRILYFQIIKHYSFSLYRTSPFNATHTTLPRPI